MKWSSVSSIINYNKWLWLLVCTCDTQIKCVAPLFTSPSASASPSSLGICFVPDHSFLYWKPGHSLPHSLARMKVLPLYWESPMWVTELALNKYPVFRTLTVTNLLVDNNLQIWTSEYRSSQNGCFFPPVR